MNAKLLAALFVLCSFPVLAAIMPSYELSAENFNGDFDAIAEADLSIFDMATGGVGIGAVRTYLENLVFDGGFLGDYKDAPTMCLEKKTADSLFVNAEGEFHNYHFSFFRASDGYNQITKSETEDFAAYMPHDIFFNLLTIYGYNSDGRSNLFIIIIEKDFFTCDLTHYQYEDLRDRNMAALGQAENVMEFEYSFFPNPTANHADLTFYLEEVQNVSLDLISPSSGAIIHRRLNDQYLPRGNYQHHFDMQRLSPGLYFLVLKTKYRRQSIPIIKIK